MKGFTVEQLMARNKALSYENDDLREKLAGVEKEKEKWRARGGEYFRKSIRLCSDNSRLRRELDNTTKKLSCVEADNEQLKKLLDKKEPLTVADLTGTLSNNGVQSIVLAFKN